MERGLELAKAENVVRCVNKKSISELFLEKTKYYRRRKLSMFCSELPVIPMAMHATSAYLKSAKCTSAFLNAAGWPSQVRYVKHHQ